MRAATLRCAIAGRPSPGASAAKSCGRWRPISRHRVGTEFHASGFHRRDSVHATSVCGYHQAPGWVGALNDGRIRVPVQGLTSLTQELSRVLKHELTHSFIRQKTHGHAPMWIQEGLRSGWKGSAAGENAAVLARSMTRTSGTGLEPAGRIVDAMCGSVAAMRTPGRWPISSTSCKSTAWGTWRGF